MDPVRQLPRRALPGLAAAAALGACSAPTPAGSGGAGSGKSLVLADPYELSGFSPVNGYGPLGVTPLYDGLMRPRVTKAATVPTFVPALAADAPEVQEGGLRWVVRTRSGVRFHDGRPFGPKDVAATFNAILDSETASPSASDLEMIEKVTVGPGRAVTFHLRYPFAELPALLTQSIAPAHLIGSGLADNSPLNTEPVGTGPFSAVKRRADRLELKANPHYFRGRVPVESITRIYVPDDNARAQRIIAGEVDGTVLPAALAKKLDGGSGRRTVSAPSADWYGITMPKTTFTRDPRVRLALNHAVNRREVARTAVLGRPASFPVPKAFGDVIDQSLNFRYDVDRANALLDQAGYRRGKDGMRAKGDQPAQFTLYYHSNETVRRDLATAFAGYAKRVGVQVDLRAGRWDIIEPLLGKVAFVQGGGVLPWTVDSLLYSTLHRRTSQTSVPYANAGNFGSAKVDAALETARRATDPKARRVAYRTVQREYFEDPHAVFLLFAEHTYVTRDSGFRAGPMLLEPHGQNLTYGPWWDIPSWRR